MKILTITAIVIYLLVCANASLAQDALPDSDPVMQGTLKYSMPQSAIDAEIGGTVVFAVSIDKSGRPSDPMLIAGPMWPCGAVPMKALSDLTSTLASAVKIMHFSPAIKGGKPIAKDVALTISLKNPKAGRQPPEVNPATGELKAGTVSGGVLNGRALRLDKPDYPAAARKNRDAGSVSIQILIDENGKVFRAGAINGAATLQLAAREAACSSKFTPTLLKGNPVKVSGVIVYNFVP